MSDESALLAAIRAQPNEDTLRLAYADWLDESGQPERAELIRVQCELARTTAEDDRRTELEVREVRLLARHAGDWAHPRPPFPTYLETSNNEEHKGYESVFRRGLLERVGWQDFAPAHAAPGGAFEQLFAAHPVRDLRLRYFAPGALTALSGRPELERVEALGLTRFGRGETAAQSAALADEARAFLRTAPLTRLTELELTLFPTDHVTGDWLRLPLFSRLRSLDVWPADHDRDAFWSALAGGACPNLTELRVPWGYNRESVASGRLFAASETCARLRQLSVSTSETSVPFPWAEVFARAPLEALQVTAGSGTDAPELLAALSAAPPTGRFRRLRIFGINATGAGVAGWLKSGYARGVRELELESTALDDAELDALAASPELARLTRLVLSGYSLGTTADGLRRLLLSPYLTGLRYLDVASPTLTADLLREFARRGVCRGLRVLSAAVYSDPGGDVLPGRESVLAGLGGGRPFPHLHTLKTWSTPDDRSPDDLRALLDSPNLPNLCVLRTGFRDTRRADWERFAAGARLAWVGGHINNGSWTVGRIALHPRTVFLPNHLDDFGF